MRRDTEWARDSSPAQLAAQEGRALAALRRSWLGAALGSAAGLVAVYLLLRPVWLYALPWAACTLALLLLGFGLLWVKLPENRHVHTGQILSQLGPGTGLTVARGAVLAGFLACLFVPAPPGRLAWMPALLYGSSAVADSMDGYLARRTRHLTRLGAHLDLELDALGILAAVSLLVRDHRLAMWYLPVGLARYAFALGTWWRGQRGKGVFELDPSPKRRLFAGMQMGFLSAVLWPIVPTSAVAVAAPIFAAPMMLGFLRDWLVASGHLDPHSPRSRRVHDGLQTGFFRWLPMLLRGAVLIGVLHWCLVRGENPLRPLGWQQVLEHWGLPGTSALVPGLVVAIFLSTCAQFIGLAGRASALVLALGLCVDLSAHPLDSTNGPLLALGLGILLLGTGALSLSPWVARDCGS